VQPLGLHVAGALRAHVRFRNKKEATHAITVGHAAAVRLWSAC
jgi:hypothetical protein